MSDTNALIRGLWEQMDSALRNCGRSLESREKEDKASRSVLDLRIDGLAKFRDVVVKEKEGVIEKFRAKYGAPGRAAPMDEEAQFWAKIGELDSALQKVGGGLFGEMGFRNRRCRVCPRFSMQATAELDAAKQELYFPKSQGYQYSFGAVKSCVGAARARHASVFRSDSLRFMCTACPDRRHERRVRRHARLLDRCADRPRRA